MGYGLTLSARREITKKEAGAHVTASKKDKGEILDRLVTEVGWSWANARRQLGKAFKRRGPSLPAGGVLRSYGLCCRVSERSECAGGVGG